MAFAVANRQGVRGIGRGLAGTFVPGGNLGLMAYDAKRLRQRSRSKTRRFRSIKRQALMDAGAVEGRIAVLQSHDPVNPLQESITEGGGFFLENPGGSNNPSLESDPFPEDGIPTMEAPAPEERGQGGDAAEGTTTRLAGTGKGIVALVLVGGILAALYAGRGTK